MTFIKNNISEIKYIFTFIYLVYFSLTFNSLVDIYLTPITEVIYPILIAVGILIMALDFFTSGLLLRFKYSWMLILFYLSCLLSIAFNIAYDPVGNVKVLIWMFIQTFLIATLNNEYDDSFHQERYRRIIEAFSLVWFAGVLISLWMFLTATGDVYQSEMFSGGRIRIGFVEGRLFGVFNDPNYASLCILISMILILVNMYLNRESLFMRIYHIIMLVADYFYIVLSGSRTGEICIYLSVGFAALFLVARFLRKRGAKALKAYLLSAVAVVASVILCFSVFNASDWFLGKVYTFANMVSSDYDEEHNYEEDLIRPDVEYNDDITNNRAKIWKDYLLLSKKQPIFGIAPRNGIEKIREYMPDSFVAKKGYDYHSGFLALLVGTGAVGFLLMVGFIAMNIIRMAIYLFSRNDKEDKYYLPIVLMSLILASSVVAAIPLKAIFFCNSFFDIVFWFVFGYAMSLIRISDTEAGKKEPTAYRLSAFLRIKNKQ